MHWNRGTSWNTGAYSIGPLLAKANLEGAHFSERVHIGRRALNGIIIVTATTNN